MKKTFNKVIDGKYTSLYGSCVNGNITNIQLISDYILDYYELLDNKRCFNRISVSNVLEKIFNYSTYNCTNTDLFSMMLEVSIELDYSKAIHKLQKCVSGFEKQSINEPKTIVVIRDYYDREY